MKTKLLLPIIFLISCQANHVEDKRLAVYINYSTKLELEVFSKETLELQKCLPAVTDNFILKLRSDSLLSFRPENNFGFVTDEIYYYLITHLDSLEPKNVQKIDDFWGPYEWSQQFELGVEYYHIDYLEIGRGGELCTECADKSHFFQVIDQILEAETSKCEWSPSYKWNQDSTIYEPQWDEVGCRYKIRRNDSNYLCLEWSCAC